MKDTLRLIINQPYDQPGRLAGIQVMKKKAGMLDTVTLFLQSPIGKLHHSFFIKHEDSEEDAYECKQAFSKIFVDHLEAISRETLKQVIDDTAE